MTDFVSRLGLLPMDTMVLDPETMFGEMRLAALEHNLSAYDASYLVLAQKLHVPLGTLDGTGERVGVKQAASAVGVPLLSGELLEAWAKEGSEGAE